MVYNRAKLKTVIKIMGVVLSIVTFLSPVVGGIIVLFSKVEAHQEYIDNDKRATVEYRAEAAEMRRDLKKVLENTSYIKGQLEEIKRR